MSVGQTTTDHSQTPKMSAGQATEDQDQDIAESQNPKIGHELSKSNRKKLF